MPSLRSGRPRPIGMESTPRQSPPVSRTAEVLYLLSRGAQLEHPHMINVHYAAHQPGPTLRDVKARLVALRGKGMPDSFSWSYKRSYKETFIWCDLFDDDFIRPLTGSGEYVLKAVQLFDVASQDGELDYEELPPLCPHRSSSPSKSSRPSSRPEHLHVENDVSMAIKKSLLLINIPQAADITSESSIDLNKQIMNNLSHSKRAPEVCSLEHSDVSSSGTNPSFEDVAENKIKHSSSKSSTAHRELASQHKDVTTDCKELATTMTSKTDEMTSIFPSPGRIRPGSEVCLRRRTWEKEVDKSTICTQFVHHKSGSDDERPGSALEVSRSNSCASGSEDPFLYGVLRKATRLGSSFRPRLCRGVDVVDSTRTKTKLHFRSKTKEEGTPNSSSFIDEPSANSPIEVSSEKKSYSTSPEKPLKEFKTRCEYFDTKERRNSNSPPVDKLINEPHSVEETLRPTQLGLAQEDSSAAKIATELSQEVDLPRSEARPFGNEALDASYRKTMEVLAKLPTSRGAYRVHTMPQREGHKSMRSESKGNKQEVKLDSKPTSKMSTDSNSRRGAPKPSCEHDAFLHHSCSIHGMDDPIVVKTPEESPENVATSKQRRPTVKKASMASFEASTVRNSCRAKATVKNPDERTIKAPRNVSKESTSKLQLNIVDESTKSQLPESFMFDSRALHSGNKQGLKMATQVAAAKVEVVAPKMNSNQEAKRSPFEPPVRSRDFKSREDRPLIPGLTSMDWERSFQEACIHSEPPTNLVLHECSAMTGSAIAAASAAAGFCKSETIDPSVVLQPSFESLYMKFVSQYIKSVLSLDARMVNTDNFISNYHRQCGRTFKLESLQVHMRGCRTVNKPKSSLATQRRASL